MVRHTLKILQHLLQNFSSVSSHFETLCIKELNSSAIRQKGESQNGGSKKTKHTKFSEKTNISYPLIRKRTSAYQGVRNVRFLGKFSVLSFLVTPL